MNEKTPLQRLQSIARIRRFRAGQNIFQIGDPAEAVYRVQSGEVHLYRHDIHGRRVLLHHARAGDFFAEASLDSTTYHCTANCVRDSELSTYDAAAMDRLISQDARFARFWVAHLSTELRRQRANVERLSLKTASDRVSHYLLSEGEPPGVLQLSGTRSELADKLGLSRETLYRTLARMKKDGRLRQEGNRWSLITI